tara:strand:+ start:165 stop:380 length:216 start_codon:yes stop_codon:yes gene_type:complete
MPLRSGKEYRKKEYRCKNFIKKMFPKETQPFNMVLLPEMGKQYKINIDFDESSKAWRKNKISLGEGMFKYK